MNRSASILGAALLAVCTFLAAQNVIPRPLPPPIAIAVKNLPQNFEPVRVTSGDAVVRICGLTAETTLTYVVKNPNPQALEGEFQFPLPPGSTVTGLALDVNGVMLDAAIVPKQRAKEVFEAVERQGLDPALVEDVGANTYRTRIWPIPAGGTRTIRIRFLSSIVSADGEFIFTLPMRFHYKLDSMRVRIEVAEPDRKVTVSGGAFSNLEFRNWQSLIAAEQTLRDIELSEDLKIAVPFLPGGTRYEKDADGQIWFSRIFDLPPDPPAAPFTAPEKLAVVWDVSLSRKTQDHALEFEFLKEYFSASAFKGKTVEVTIFLLRNDLETSETFAVRDGNAGELTGFLKSVPFDGATDLALLRSLPQDVPALVFTDGVDTFGAAPFGKDTPYKGAARHFISVTTSANTALLHFLSDSLHGEYAELTGMTVRDGAEKIRRGKTASPLLQLPEISALKHPESYLEERAVTGRFIRVCGRIHPADSPEGANAPEGTLIRTEYALMKLENMKRDPRTTEDEFAGLGRIYGIVTPGTSMLVLESFDQYWNYRIRPPESMKDWCAKYDRMLSSFSVLKKKEKDLKEVMERYRKEIGSWYEKNVPKEKPAVPAKKPMKMSAVNRVSAVSADGAADREDRSFAMEEVRAEAAAPALVRSSASGAAKAKSAGSASSSAKVRIKAWDSKAPYLAAMKAAPEKAYEIYLEYRDREGGSAGFYTDCADYFRREKNAKLAARIVSNLAEMELENVMLLRVLGYQLRFIGDLPGAEQVFRKVLKLAPEEAQSLRDLALTLDDEGRFQEAAELLMKVILGTFDNRFPGIDLIAVTELNRVIARAARSGVKLEGIDPAVVFPLEAGLRIVMSWDTDQSDMDLHVTDPWGEDCYYGHRLNVGGGHLSFDFTGGYGPEEFMTRKVLPGEYRIWTHYFGQRSARLIGPVTLYAEVFTDYGCPNEKKETLIFRLGTKNEKVEIGTVSGSGAAEENAVRDYQVKANETLEKIAEKELGSAARAEEIRHLNGLKENEVLQTGRILKIPAK